MFHLLYASASSESSTISEYASLTSVYRLVKLSVQRFCVFCFHQNQLNKVNGGKWGYTSVNGSTPH